MPARLYIQRYKELQRATKSYKGLQRATKSYKELQRATKGYKGSKLKSRKVYGPPLNSVPTARLLEEHGLKSVVQGFTLRPPKKRGLDRYPATAEMQDPKGVHLQRY